jgi:YtkA-like
MKESVMKNFMIVMITLALGLSLAQAKAFEQEAKFRSTKVHISSEQPLTTGVNTFVLDISKESKALEESKVDVRAFMPAMPGMPAMEFKAAAKSLGKGKYEVTLNIAMHGTWQVHIFITPKEGKRSRVKTSIDF